MDLVELGKLLKEERLKLGLSAKSVANAAKIAPGYLSILENARNPKTNQPSRPSADIIARLAQVLSLPVERLFVLADYQDVIRLGKNHSSQNIQQDWGDAPNVESFYGRIDQLSTVVTWVTKAHCRVVAVYGIGGIGKTTLITKAANDLKANFDYIFWRSLRSAPPLSIILQKCIHFIAGINTQELPKDEDDLISQMIELLRTKKCLLILDDIESILQSGQTSGQYRRGYEAYGKLIERIGDIMHQSCLLLSGREKLREISRLEGSMSSVKSLHLGGMPLADLQNIFLDKGILDQDLAKERLVNLYGGNPLSVKIVCAFIQDVFDGDIAKFLDFVSTSPAILRDYYDVLEQQFDRLSEVEQRVMYFLAVEQEPITLFLLLEDMIDPTSRIELVEAVDSLQRRSLIENRGAGLFSIQPEIMEYTIERFTKLILNEILHSSLNLLHRFPLMKAQAKDYIRESQIHLILKPIITQLLTISEQDLPLDQRFKALLDSLRSAALSRGYAAGNLLNLLVNLRYNLSDYDFSNLYIRQAYLQNVNLSKVNFSCSTLVNSVFSETFGGVLAVAFKKDVLAAGTANGEIHSWLMEDFTSHFIKRDHSGQVRAVAFSNDGKLLASGSDDQTIRLWDGETGECLFTFYGHSEPVRAVVFSKDEKLLASGSEDQTVRLWDVETRECLKTLEGHNGWVRSVVFSRSDDILFTGDDQDIRVWSVNSGECLNILHGHSGPVWALALNPSGKVLASSGDDALVLIWDAETSHNILALNGHSKPVRSVAYSPDGRLLASGGEDQIIRLWDTVDWQPVASFQGHSQAIRALIFSPDGKYLASGSDDQTLRIWDLEKRQSLKTLHGYANPIWSIACDPAGLLLASGEDQSIRVRDINNWQILRTLDGHTDTIRAITYSPDGKLLASGSDDHTIRLWNAANGENLEIHGEHTKPVRAVVFSPDGKWLASGSEDQTVRLRSIANGEPGHILNNYNGWVRALTFSPDGSYLISGDSERIHIWNMQMSKDMGAIAAHKGPIWTLAFGPNMSRFASGSEDQTIKVWDIKTQSCLLVLEGHTKPVRAVAFSPDGKWLASGSEDQTVRLWNMRTGKLELVMDEHLMPVRSVTFNRDGHWLASSSEDETIRIWDITTGHAVKVIKTEGPYQDMNITGVKGLTEGEKSALKALGAID